MSTAVAVPQTRTSTSPEEQARRASYVASANGHSAMEGQFGSPLLTDLQARYIAGEIDTKDAIQELNTRYGLA